MAAAAAARGSEARGWLSKATQSNRRGLLSIALRAGRRFAPMSTTCFAGRVPLDKLGAELKKRGQTLGYHNHDAELRHAAREFHHMILGTDPDKVFLCLDSHWIFRGAGDSQVALFDVVKLYGKRIVELHLRQSKKGIWTEVFGEGDIDHKRLVNELVKLKVKPHVVLEQAVEAKSPNTLKAVEAHKRGLAYVKTVFAPLA